MTPLRDLEWTTSVEDARQAVASGVDPTSGDNLAIRWASERGHLSVVEFLASLPGVDPAAQDNQAIREAAENGHLPVVELIRLN